MLLPHPLFFTGGSRHWKQLLGVYKPLDSILHFQKVTTDFLFFYLTSLKLFYFKGFRVMNLTKGNR